jgi:hypothetical protein
LERKTLSKVFQYNVQCIEQKTTTSIHHTVLVLQTTTTTTTTTRIRIPIDQS